jgi:hypothetical protein
VRRKRKTELPVTSVMETPSCPFGQIARPACADSSNTCRLNGPRLLCPSWVLKLAGAPSPSVSNYVLTRTPENVALNGSCSSAWASMGAKLNATMRLAISVLRIIPLLPSQSGVLWLHDIVIVYRQRAYGRALKPSACGARSYHQCGVCNQWC